MRLTAQHKDIGICLVGFGLYAAFMAFATGCGVEPTQLAPTGDQKSDPTVTASAPSPTAPQVGAPAKATTQAAAPEAAAQGGIRLLARGAALPKCTSDLEGVTYYVVDDEAFSACVESEWTAVDLRGDKGAAGKAGADGKDGKAGADGAPGEKGETGAAGAVGATGAAGTAGATGAAGAAGADGAAAKTLRLMSGSTYVGDVYSLDKSTTDYWAVRGAARLEIDRADGTFPNAYLVFAGPNCTGASRMLIPNGFFANTYVRGDNAVIVQATGANLGVFAYTSRLPQASACSNTSGTTNLSWTYQTPTLPFSYPVVAPEIEN